MVIQLKKFERTFHWEGDGLPVKEDGMSCDFIQGYGELASLFEQYGGRSYEKGLYRMHDVAGAIKWTAIIEAAYPDFAGRIRCFAYSWAGDMFVQRMANGKSFIMIFEIATGDYFELEQTITGFHEEDLIDYREDTLKEQQFREVTSYRNIKLLRRNECLGYIVSPLLDGEDAPGNMEVTDMEVNWSIQQQIMDNMNDMD